MKKYTLYDGNSGKIIKAKVTNNIEGAEIDEGQYWYEGEMYFGRSHYFVSGAPMPRPELGVDASLASLTSPNQSVTLSLPEGANVTAYNQEGDAFVETVDASGAIDLEFDTVGSFTIRIAPPFPWLPFDGVVEISS